MVGVHERIGGELCAKQIRARVEEAEHFLKSRTEPEAIHSFLLSESDIESMQVLRSAVSLNV